MTQKDLAEEYANERLQGRLSGNEISFSDNIVFTEEDIKAAFNAGRKSVFDDFPTQSPVCSRNDGLPFRVADLTISFPKWRSKSVEALGNAWVPQVAYEIFKAIDNYDKMHKL